MNDELLDLAVIALIGLAALVLMLVLFIWELQKKLEQSREDLDWQRRFSADMGRGLVIWKARALYPDLRPFWDVIERAVPDDPSTRAQGDSERRPPWSEE